MSWWKNIREDFFHNLSEAWEWCLESRENMATIIIAIVVILGFFSYLLWGREPELPKPKRSIRFKTVLMQDDLGDLPGGIANLRDPEDGRCHALYKSGRSAASFGTVPCPEKTSTTSH